VTSAKEAPSASLPMEQATGATLRPPARP
jgi:hypothetical protein